jgi:hypothetical protein
VGDARIVDQDVDQAERPLGGVEGARHGGAVAHVGRDRERPAAGERDALCDRVEPVGAAGDQHHRGAGLRQQLGEMRPDAARGAGDERHPSGEVEQVGCGHKHSRLAWQCEG